MYKRYQGNSGKVIHVEERHAPPPPEPPHGPRPPKPPGPPPRPDRPGLCLPGLEMETEDLLLLLILYLLYRESGDNELLMIIGAMFLL